MRSCFLNVLLLLTAAGSMGTFVVSKGTPENKGRIAQRTKTPVLVELFTSEGCSSCPPADDLLAEIDRAHWIGNAEVIVLSEHVDYWNRLGWFDPFSNGQFSDRQERYAVRFSQGGIYTPQMVVDGREALVGSDRIHAMRAIAEAARHPKAIVTLALAAHSQVKAGNLVDLTVQVEGFPAQGSGEVFLAVTESQLHSQVLAGENSGRRLNHTAVVRRLMALGSVEPGEHPFMASPEVLFEPGWKRENVQAVAFVQEQGNRRIWGAASLRLASTAP
jgi:hypothetical protein